MLLLVIPLLILYLYVVFSLVILARAQTIPNGQNLMPFLYWFWPTRPLFWMFARRDVFLDGAVDKVLEWLATDGIMIGRRPKVFYLTSAGGFQWKDERHRPVLATCFMSFGMILVNPDELLHDQKVGVVFMVCHEIGHWVDHHHKRPGHWFTKQLIDEDKEYFANAMAWYILEIAYRIQNKLPLDRQEIQKRVACCLIAQYHVGS